MKTSVLLGILFGALGAYLLYTPVPDGLTEPWKYRLLVAFLRVPKAVASIYAVLNPGNEFAYIQTYRYMRELPDHPSSSQVQGSNIRSMVTTFDGVRVRLYESIQVRQILQPAVIYIHGGGMAVGSADGYDGLTRELAERLDMVVVSIDYRLAPENPFPAGHNDCVRATKWFLKHAEDFGVDANRVAISGDSAGGHFCEAVSQVIHDDDNLPNLKLQVLIYPSTHSLDFLSPSYQKYDAEFGQHGILPTTRVGGFISMYMMGKADPFFIKQTLANEHLLPTFRKKSPYMKYVNHDAIPVELRHSSYYTPPSKWNTHPGNETLWKSVKRFYLDPRFAPLMRKNMTGLPKAFITTCGFDSIRDDGIFYADRLDKAGVDVTWKHYESAFHGILWMGRLFRFGVGNEMENDIINFIKTNIYDS